MPAPVLVGSITSQATGALRFEFLQFGGGASGGLATSSCTSTPCTVANQSGSWISSVTRGSTGVYTATVASGIFSSPPNLCSKCRAVWRCNNWFSELAR